MRPFDLRGRDSTHCHFGRTPCHNSLMKPLWLLHFSPRRLYRRTDIAACVDRRKPSGGGVGDGVGGGVGGEGGRGGDNRLGWARVDSCDRGFEGLQFRGEGSTSTSTSRSWHGERAVSKELLPLTMCAVSTYIEYVGIDSSP